MRAWAIALVLVGCGGGGGGSGSEGTPADDGGAPSKPPARAGDGGGGGGGTDSGGAADSGPGEIGNYGPKDMPAFRTPAELCAYVNTERQGYSNHQRFRGPPWTGAYHDTTTWPLTLAVDPTLSAEAASRAQKLAAGGSPEGSPYSDGSPPPHQYLWITGVDTSHYVVASMEQPGNWTPDLVGNITAGITSSNGTTRMALFYHDPGGAGPVLSHVGCGGARSPGGASWWWVVVLGP